MTKGEKILAVIAIIAVILKMLLVPGGGLLAVISFTLLSILYFPLGFATLNNIPLSKIFSKSSYAGISTMRILGTIGLGMGLSGIVSGILFRIQFYPTARLTLISAFNILVVAGIIAFIIYIRNKSEFYKKIILKIFLYGIIGLVMFKASHNSLMKMFHRDKPELMQELKMSE
jgi:hypothetical protein